MTYETNLVAGKTIPSMFSVELDGRTEIPSFWKEERHQMG